MIYHNLKIRKRKNYILVLEYFNKEKIYAALTYPELVNKLEVSFCNKYEVPPRLHYSYNSGQGEESSTLLLMPAWKNEKYVGLKVITVSPYNSYKDLATIQGIYILMDAVNGQIIAQFDAKSLTNIRTAASSALASKFLSKKEAKSMLMIGTGALAPELIKAHCTVRPIRRVWVWGRNIRKAKEVAKNLSIDGVDIVPIEKIKHQSFRSMREIYSFLIVLFVLNLSVGPVFAKPKGTWADVQALAGKEVRVKPRKGTSIYGVLKTVNDEEIVIQTAGKKALSGDEVTLKKDEVKKVWNAILFFRGRKTAQGVLIGAVAGAAILGGIAGSQNSGETGEDVPFTVGAAVIGAGLGAGLGALAGFFTTSRHKKRDLVFSQ